MFERKTSKPVEGSSAVNVLAGTEDVDWTGSKQYLAVLRQDYIYGNFDGVNGGESQQPNFVVTIGGTTLFSVDLPLAENEPFDIRWRAKCEEVGSNYVKLRPFVVASGVPVLRGSLIQFSTSAAAGLAALGEVGATVQNSDDYTLIVDNVNFY